VSQRNVPSSGPPPRREDVAPPGDDGSVPTVDLAQGDESSEYQTVPTPTSAFNTAEVAEAAAQAGLRASALAQPPTMPNALPPPGLFPGAGPGTVPGARTAGVPPIAQTLKPPLVAPGPARSSMPPLPPQGSAYSPAPPPPAPPLPSTPPQPIAPFAPAPPPAGTATGQSVVLRAELPREIRAASAHVTRSRAYAFVLDARGSPIEMGSGRFAKAYLAEERWLESKTDFRRPVVIKILQKGVDDEDRLRFQIEKELLERVQGHPNIVGLCASGESDDPEFVPAVIRDKVENDFVILERLDMSLEERLKGARARNKREDLLSYDLRERLFRVLDYMMPVASAIEYAHLVKNVCHRDIKPANVLVGLPDPNLRGATLEVRLADFNVAKLHDDDVSLQMTSLRSVPGTLFFQSPEQETNILEVLVNVVQGSAEVEFFEDFYIQIAKNDSFSLYNRGDEYTVLYADRAKKRIVLDRPYRESGEVNVRAKIRKSVGRPADIYSLGALFYYLVSGAYANPKTLYDAFHKFIEYESPDETNTIDSYLSHEYGIIESLRAPKQPGAGAAAVAPADRFFSYKHYLDGNGDLIEPHVMKIIARCMIRNKPDSYCQAHDVETRGISMLVQDLIDLYAVYGFHPAAGSTQMVRRGHTALGKSGFRRGLDVMSLRMKRAWRAFLRVFGIRG
jgi:serine/threonine protein kinase